MIDKEKYTAAIFRRGQKKELFDDGDDSQGEEFQLKHKLEDLHEIWHLPRSGYVCNF